MLFPFTLDQNDYLSYLFYSTSRSVKVRKRRSLNKLILLMIYMATGIYLFIRNGPVASAIFFLLCFPLYFLYNTFEKKQYLKHFTRFINDHFKDNLGKPASIELADNSFHVLDDEDNWYAYEDIEEIMETNELVIIQLKTGVAVLLPKNKIENAEGLVTQLNNLSTSKNIKYTQNLEWKWK